MMKQLRSAECGVRIGMLWLALCVAPAHALTIDFESLALDAIPYENGSNSAGGFTFHGAHFNNNYTASFGTWDGFALSRMTDTTTPGYTNQYSAYPGSGAAGSAKFMVAYNGLDSGFGEVPVITLPALWQPTSVALANTTYAALSMLVGDQFAKKFGGADGTDPDWFKLTIRGRAADDSPLGELDFYLADFRGTEDFIRSGWTTLDLTSLRNPALRKLSFHFSSSDVGMFGLNTPTYVALDNLAIHHAGDFNANDAIDAADYTVWRDGPTPAATNYELWRSAFGPSAAGGTAVPEPAAVVVALLLGVAGLRVRQNALR